MSKVFVAGSLHLDVVVDAPHLPQLDETVMGPSVAYRFGGKGGNQAVAAARMGARVDMAGCVGRDGFADQVLTQLDIGNVGCAQVRRVDGATGMSVAIVDANGDYGAVVVSGVNQDIDPDMIDPGNAVILLLQNEIPERVNLSVARKASGATIILNAAPMRPMSDALLRLCDLLVVNRVEAAQLCNVQPKHLVPAQAAKSLLEKGPKAVLITMGARGACLATATEVSFHAPPQTSVGSSHGAGDAFVGALAAELAREAPLKQAIGFASAAAAQYVATPADQRDRITRADVHM